MSTTTTREKAYCPSCDGMVNVKKLACGEGNYVEVCARDENLMIYDSRKDWEESERERVQRMKQCGSSKKLALDGKRGHNFQKLGETDSANHCTFCGLPEGTEPEETLPDGVSPDG